MNELTVSFSDLRKAQLQERHSSVLSALPQDFFVSTRSYLTVLKSEAGLENEFSNAEGVFRNLIELRQQKILWKALKDLKAGAVSSEDLAEEEKEFYLNLVKLLNGFEELVLGGKAGTEATTVVGEKTVEASEKKRTRFLADLPAFEWVDSKSYGPFKKGDVVELENGIESFLLEKNAVEIV